MIFITKFRKIIYFIFLNRNIFYFCTVEIKNKKMNSIKRYMQMMMWKISAEMCIA